jgi:hypothetical protein
VTRNVRVVVGANNLFNRYPDRTNALLRDEYYRANDVSYICQYPTISPFGINGGYYYTKLNVNFQAARRCAATRLNCLPLGHRLGACGPPACPASARAGEGLIPMCVGPHATN